MGGKRAYFGGRIPDDLREELAAINERYGTTDSVVLERLLRAWVAYVRGQNAARWPIVIEEMAAAGEDAPEGMAAEEPGEYGEGAALVRKLSDALHAAEALNARQAARRRAGSAKRG